MINGGRVLQHITPENYPEEFGTLRELNRWLRCYELNCDNLITIGALASFPTVSANLIDEHPVSYMHKQALLINHCFKFSILNVTL